MRIPYTVPRNVFEAYRCSYETTRLSLERDRTIRSEDTFWDEGRLPSLRTLALHAIAAAWKDYPILDELPTCEDRVELIEILPTDLPFELTIKVIEDEHYWKRCSKDRQMQHTSHSFILKQNYFRPTKGVVPKPRARILEE